MSEPIEGLPSWANPGVRVECVETPEDGWSDGEFPAPNPPSRGDKDIVTRAELVSVGAHRAAYIGLRGREGVFQAGFFRPLIEEDLSQWRAMLREREKEETA